MTGEGLRRYGGDGSVLFLKEKDQKTQGYVLFLKEKDQKNFIDFKAIALK